jgi:hypothetical protein
VIGVAVVRMRHPDNVRLFGANHPGQSGRCPGRLRVDAPIRQAQEVQVCDTEDLSSRSSFPLAQPPGSVRAQAGNSTFARAEKGNDDAIACAGVARDDPSAPDRLVVRMRRDDELRHRRDPLSCNSPVTADV